MNKKHTYLAKRTAHVVDGPDPSAKMPAGDQSSRMVPPSAVPSTAEPLAELDRLLEAGLSDLRPETPPAVTVADPSPTELATLFEPAADHQAEIAALQAEIAHLRQQVADLQTQLAEREDLVQALTERLERAAEQLDRLQRSGAQSHRGAAGGGGWPPELLADHSTLLGEMRDVVQQWQDLQAGMVLGQLRVQVSELRDLVVDRLNQALLASERPPSAAEPAPPRAAEPSPPSTPVPAAPPAGAAGSFWERQKAALLGEPLPISQVEAAVAAVPPETPEPLPLPEPPSAVELATATPDELARAVEERDAYIALLREQLQAYQGGALPSASLPDFETLPELQRTHLVAWEEHIRTRLRALEVQLSLERAKLSREQLELHQQRSQVEGELRRLGRIAATPGGASERPEHPEKHARRRGWFGKS